MKLDQKREKYQRSGLIYAKRKSGSRRGFFSISGSPLLQKPTAFHACIFFFIFSGKLDIKKIRREFGISWIEPFHYSKSKRSILQVHHMPHHMKHGKLNAPVFFFTRSRPIFKRIVNEICVLRVQRSD